MFEAGTDVNMQALWDALCATHGDGKVVDRPAGAEGVGGQLLRFAWAVQP